MASKRVRFIHTGDWRLEEPLGGVLEVPALLREEFTDAPFRAAARVVEAAIREDVDFVLLAGDILSTETASPYALEFLLGQFERLQEQQIAAYWIGGLTDDADLWPTQLALPKNVYRFPVDRAEEVRITRDDQEIASLIGRSGSGSAPIRAAEYAGSKQPVPRIGLAYGAAPRKALGGKGIDYWALGGRPHREQLLEGSPTATYAGSPQGRRPSETGCFGCELVVLAGGQAECRQIETSAARWQPLQIPVPPDSSLGQLRELIGRHLDQVHTDASSLTLISCTLTETQHLSETLTPAASRELLDSLPDRLSETRKCCISLSQAPQVIPESLRDEESILGDFLRAVRELEQSANSWQELAAYLPQKSAARDRVVRYLSDSSESERQRLWHDVASLGVTVLRGDHTPETSYSSTRD